MFAPVARMNDMHVCPMQTPAVAPIPHVGGPIMGPCAATVMAGGVPVSVLGDIAVCAGPPDVMAFGSTTVLAMGLPVVRICDMTAHMGNAIVGLPTVLVGDSGGAGTMQAATMSAAKAGGSAFTRAECDAKAAQALVIKSTAPPASKTTWIEIEFVDEAGAAVPFQRVEVRDASGTAHLAFSDEHGLIRVDDLAPGPAKVALPDLDGSSWSPAPAGTPRTAASSGAAGGAAPSEPAAAPERQQLRVVLQTLGGQPVAGAGATLRLGQSARALSTDGKGAISAELPAGVDKGEIVLNGAGTTLHGVAIPFTIGALPPEATVLGQQARLNNLGYRAGSTENPASLVFRSAVEEFQCDEGLVVDGRCDPATQAKLRSVHGS